MKKKYKLIKRYPRCPSAWDLGTILVQNGDYYVPVHSPEANYHYEKSEIENYSEFWKEIEEKEYEILTFNTPQNTKLYVGKMANNCWYIYDKNLGRNYDRDEKWMLAYKYIPTSIKRLSDGEIFTIGDKLNSHSGVFKLVKIIYYENSLHFWASYTENNEEAYTLEYISKSKSDIVSEDGVPLVDNDTVYVISNDFSSNNIISFTINGHSSDNQEKARKVGKIWFSTREAALNYFNENKPQYSMKDINEPLKTTAWYMKQDDNNKLKLIRK